MEAQMATPMPQTPLYVYQPETQPDQRHGGHFYAYPAHYNGPMAFHPEHMKPMQHTQFNPQMGIPQPIVYSHPHFVSTPMASPQPISHRPTILIDRQSPALRPLDTEAGPATPALSSSGSTISSPRSSCGMLATPVNGSATPDSLVGVKQGCEGEVLSESLAGGEISRGQSPPLTPSKF